MIIKKQKKNKIQIKYIYSHQLYIYYFREEKKITNQMTHSYT